MAVHALPVESLDDGGHACCFYDSDEQQRVFLTAFVRSGLESGNKVICIADAASTRRILDAHVDEAPVAAALATGQLEVLGSDEAYVAGGAFDPDAMLARWWQESARADADGYAGLRITGDVTWYARDLPGVGRLLEYERTLEEVLPATRASALCQYDRRRLDDALLAEAAAVHGQAPAALAPIAPETFRVLRGGPGALRLLGELDLAAGGALDEALAVAIADGTDRLTLDLAGLRFVDAAGVSALCRPAVEGLATLELRRPRPAVRKVLSILHSDWLAAVHIHQSEER